MSKAEWVDEALELFWELAPERLLAAFWEDRNYAYQLALAVYDDDLTPTQAVTNWITYDEDYERGLRNV